MALRESMKSAKRKLDNKAHHAFIHQHHYTIMWLTFRTNSMPLALCSFVCEGFQTCPCMEFLWLYIHDIIAVRLLLLLLVICQCIDPPPPSPIPLRHKTKPKKPKQKDRSTVAWTSQMVRLSNISLRGNDSKMVPAEGSHQPHSGTWTSDKQSKIKLIAQPCKSSKIIRNNERKKQTKKGFLQNKCHVTWASQSGRFARQRAQVQVQLLDFLLLLLIITRQLHLQNEN